MSPDRSNLRRGSVGLAILLVLVVLQLLVVGVLLSGARDQDLAVNRLDSFRSGYAAEAGENMALREVMNNADEDGDGAIGTISSDGNPANDPALGPARFYVNAATVGNQKTLTSRGSVGAVRRQIDETVDLGSGGAGGTTMVAFSRAGSDRPRYAVWNGSAWGSDSSMPDIGGNANFVVARACPKRAETLFVAQDELEHVNVVLYKTSAWGAVTQVCSGTSQTNNRPFDAAYEQASGDGLVVYWKDSSSRIGYRTYNGTTLSSESTLNLSGATASAYMALFPRPGTDTIILLAEDSYGGGTSLSAAVWNGSSWGSWMQLTSNGIASTKNECFSLAFEGVSNTALCVYAENNISTPRYRTWNGSSWSSQSSMPSVGAEPQWIRLVPDPASDEILFGELDSAKAISVNRWNGSSWGSNVQIESDTEYSSRRQFDIAYEYGTGDAIVAYSQSGQDRLRYRTWNGSSWSSEKNGTDLGEWQSTIQLRTGTAIGQVFVAAQGVSNGLYLVQWNGTSLSNDLLMESNLGGSASTEPFMLAVPGQAGRPRVASWQEVQPQ